MAQQTDRLLISSFLGSKVINSLTYRFINSLHHGDLMIPLDVIGLVNTDLVDPESSRAGLLETFKCSQSHKSRSAPCRLAVRGIKPESPGWNYCWQAGAQKDEVESILVLFNGSFERL